MSSSGPGAFVVRSAVRVKILEDLSKGPKTPTELASIENEHVSHVSRALAELKACGLVESAFKSSNRTYYRTTQRGFELSSVIMRIAK